MLFTILNISDVHIGHPARDLDSLEVFESLFRDLAQQTQRHGPPHFVIFSGDAAYGTHPDRPLNEQYGQFKFFLERVLSATGRDLQDTPFFMVPGNHDVDRNVVDATQTEWLNRRRQNPEASKEIGEEMRLGSKSPLWTRFLDRLRPWATFVEGLNQPGIKFDSELMTSSLVLEHEGTKIGVFGLNSAWAATNDEDRGRLFIGKHQFQTAQDFAAGVDFPIAVAHHPPSCLGESESRSVEERLRTRFRMFFHGHEHRSWFEDLPQHASLAAGACYQGSEKDNSYSWIQIDFRERQATVFLRTYSDRGAGGWHQDSIEGLTDEKRGGTLRALFSDPASRTGSRRRRPDLQIEAVESPAFERARPLESLESVPETMGRNRDPQPLRVPSSHTLRPAPAR